MPAERKRIVVIGGGISGLAAAYHLKRGAQQRGLPLDVTLLEREQRTGGKLLTVHEGDCIVEAGPESVLASKPEAVQLCEQLGLADRLIGTNERQRGTYIYSRGRLHDLPAGFSGLVPGRLGPVMHSDLISPTGKARLLLDYVLPPRRANGDEPVAAFMRRRLGREAFDRLIEPLMSGIYAGNADQLSLAATFPQLRQLELSRGSLLRGISRTAAPTSAGAGTRPLSGFVTLRGGMAELSDTLAERLTGELCSGAEVRSIARTASGWTVRIAETDGMPARTLEADAVLLATPAFVTAGLLAETDAELAALHHAIPHGSTATITLAYARERLARPPAGFGFVVPGIEPRPLLACTFMSNKFEGRAPDGIVLIRCFLGRIGREEPLALDDAGLVNVARAELKAILHIDTETLWTRVFRWTRGMPQYSMGHVQRVQQIEQRASMLPGLYLAGAAYRGVGIPDCIRSAHGAADRALAEFIARN